MNIVYPINFTKNICSKCGTEGTLIYVDKNGNDMRTMIYPAFAIRCINCGTKFSIRWINKEDSDKMIPITCSDKLKDDFEKEIIEKSKQQRRQI